MPNANVFHVQTAGLGIRDLLLKALTVSSGAIDAISFLALGKVFTAFMTGNIVFLGLRVAGAVGPGTVAIIVSMPRSRRVSTSRLGSSSPLKVLACGPAE